MTAPDHRLRPTSFAALLRALLVGVLCGAIAATSACTPPDCGDPASDPAACPSESHSTAAIGDGPAAPAVAAAAGAMGLVAVAADSTLVVAEGGVLVVTAPALATAAACAVGAIVVAGAVWIVFDPNGRRWAAARLDEARATLEALATNVARLAAGVATAVAQVWAQVATFVEGRVYTVGASGLGLSAEQEAGFVEKAARAAGVPASVSRAVDAFCRSAAAWSALIAYKNASCHDDDGVRLCDDNTSCDTARQRLSDALACYYVRQALDICRAITGQPLEPGHETRLRQHQQAAASCGERVNQIIAWRVAGDALARRWTCSDDLTPPFGRRLPALSLESPPPPPVACATHCYLTTPDRGAAARATDGRNPMVNAVGCALAGDAFTGTDENTCWVCRADGWSLAHDGACTASGPPGCSATNACYLTAVRRATDNRDPSNPPTECTAPGTPEVFHGTDGASCWRCDGSPAAAWRSVACPSSSVGTLPGCDATNQCYLTAASEATDGRNPAAPPVRCAVPEPTRPSRYHGTGDGTCWQCRTGAWEMISCL